MKQVVPSSFSSFRKWRAPKVDYGLVFLFDQSQQMEVVGDCECYIVAKSCEVAGV
jgi:hypothetical protein